MSLSGTFSTATQALNAQAQHLSNIATNIANVQTNAYKVQRTDFKTLLNHVSGRNDRFFAVDTVDQRFVDKQGLLLTTQRQLDLAIDGRGMFVTNVLPDGSGEWQFTRDGSFIGRSISFDTDSDGDGINDQGATGPQVITLDLTDTTQFQANGNVEVFNFDHDGLLEGRLNRTFFDSDGTLFGSFSNSSLKPLFKLPMATFAAVNNLEAVNGNFFIARPEAGTMELQSLGSVTGIAQIVVGALEQSNVDLADQFSKMIVTQRAYSSSATVLRTADEMAQQARDLKR